MLPPPGKLPESPVAQHPILVRASLDKIFFNKERVYKRQEKKSCGGRAMWGFVSMGKTVCDSERDGSPNSVRKTDFWDKYEVAIYVVSSNALDAVC